MTVRLGTPAAWAIFSDDATFLASRPPDNGGACYRYALGREWPGAARSNDHIAWCMLNPSTATHLELDPTLRRCESFSRAWGYGGMVIVNVYAFRATDPKNLPRIDRRPSPRAIGPDNGTAIGFWTAGRDVVVGWGKHCDPDRAWIAYRVIETLARLVDCLGTNKDGSPTHPLYLADATERRPWSPPA